MAESSLPTDKLTNEKPRDYSMFDAELSGAALNMHLLGRLMHWMRPYRVTLAVSALLVLVASTLQVLLPVIISLVVVDHIIRGQSALSPDLGMVDLSEFLASVFGTHPPVAACLRASASPMIIQRAQVTGAL